MAKSYYQAAIVCLFLSVINSAMAMQTREVTTIDELEYATFINYSSLERFTYSLAALLRPHCNRPPMQAHKLAEFINKEIADGSTMAAGVAIEALTQNRMSHLIAEVLSYVKVCQDFLKCKEEEAVLNSEDDHRFMFDIFAMREKRRRR